MKANIAVLPGDGIGPEVTKEAVLLLQEVAFQFGHQFEFQYASIGGTAIDEYGTPLPQTTIDICLQADAVLLGAVGGPKWDTGSVRPEAGLLGLRKVLGVYANLRPVKLQPALIDASPLKPDVVSGADFLIVRELTGGLYFGTPRGRLETADGLQVVDTLQYSEAEIERILRLGFETARTRNKSLVSVDKANVLESSRVWREIANRLATQYPDVTLSHMLVDNAAMQIIRDPQQFDVLVTENLFGDILSDEAAMITGSIGLLPSASLGQGGPGLFEPIHGSAPDIAGRNIANPLGTLASAAMLLEYGLGLYEEARAVHTAITSVLDEGARSADLAAGKDALSTQAMGQLVRAAIKRGVVS